MQIHQLSVHYVSEQDRILARINTTAGEELRLWFTRRLTLGLWPLLNRVLAQQATAADPAVVGEEAQKMVAQFKKEQTLRQADFRTPYKDQPATLPLGTEPLLVTEVQLSPLAHGQVQLHLSEKLPETAAPRGFQMALEQELLHGLAHLLEQALRQSDWQVGLPPAQAGGDDAAEAPPAPTGGKPPYLN